MQARYYDPVIGRFYSNDPVGYTAKNPVMSFNRYLYANNNPYKYTDPNGEFSFLAALAFGAVEATTITVALSAIADIIIVSTVANALSEFDNLVESTNETSIAGDKLEQSIDDYMTGNGSESDMGDAQAGYDKAVENQANQAGITGQAAAAIPGTSQSGTLPLSNGEKAITAVGEAINRTQSEDVEK